MLIDISALDAVLFSFFWTDLQSVKKCLKQKDGGVFSSDADIAPLLNLEYAYNPNPLKATFFSVTENSCLMFPNLQDGWYTLFHYIARRTKAKSCYLRIMDDSKIYMPSNRFTFIDNEVERMVYVQQETNWVFYEQGEALAFENTNNYTNRLKKARLNKNIMLKYCERLGILKQNTLKIDEKNAFSYELYWKGKFAGSEGTGPKSLKRK